MEGDTVREIRRQVSEGLRAINEANGGRHMSAVARAIGVDRTTVTRWLHGSTTASVDHCRALAGNFPGFFTEQTLIELHTQAALGIEPDEPLLTVGATVLRGGADVHRAAAEALRIEPDAPEDRVCKLTAMHLDRRGIDAVDLDPHMEPDMSDQVWAFRAAMSERAAQGWRIRNVVVTANPARIDMLEAMAATIDGPDVEIRAYPMPIPLVLSPLIVANREVFLAYDHRRFERPHAALGLRSRTVVQWASAYFDDLFLDAPYLIRDTHGPNAEGLRALRDAVVDRGGPSAPADPPP